MKIFISYRRDDSAGYAGRLFDYLSAHFGANNIFMDIDTIEPGEDFRKVISKAVGTCDVVLVMIGKLWSTITDSQGQKRLDDPKDWVRMEIDTALSDRRVRVIPVLVRDAAMPSEHELPEGLKELVWRHASELSDSRFQHDVNKLISVIEHIETKTPKDSMQPGLKPRAQNTKNALLWIGSPILVVLVFLIWMLSRGQIGATDDTPKVIPHNTNIVTFTSPSSTQLPPVTTATLPPTETLSPVPSVTPPGSPLEEIFPQAGDGQEFTFGDEFISRSFVTNGNCSHTEPYGVRLDYSAQTDSDAGGWGVQWKNSSIGYFDVSDSTALSFWVKGTSGNETFQVVLADLEGVIEDVKIQSLATVTVDWAEISIPLSLYSQVNLASINVVEFDFFGREDAGSICIDDISFMP